MASDRGIISFAFPREIRDLIYPYLTSEIKEKSFTIISTEALYASDTDLGIINTSKAVQHEMVEGLCPSNTFKLTFPWSETKPQALNREVAALMVHVEIYMDLRELHRVRFRAECHDPEIQRISGDGEIRELLRVLQRYIVKLQSCRITIRDYNHFISLLLRPPFLDVVQTLVGTLLIIVVKYKPDLRKLGAFFAPGLGPSTVHNEWPIY